MLSTLCEVFQVVTIILLAVNVILLRRELSKRDIEINEILYELSNYEKLDLTQKRKDTTLENKIGTWIK